MINERLFDLLEWQLKQNKKAKSSSQLPGGIEITYKPFYSSLSVKNSENFNLEVEDGNTIHKNRFTPERYVGRLELRMGDYEEGGSSASIIFNPSVDVGENAKIMMWHKLNEAFWKCTKNYQKRYGDTLGLKDFRDKYIYFSKEDKSAYRDQYQNLDIDEDEIEEMLKDVTSRISRPEILDIYAELKVEKWDKYFLDTNGTKIFSTHSIYSTLLRIRAADDNNLIIPHLRAFNGSNISSIPSYDELLETGEEMVEELIDIINSPIQPNGTFPVILDHLNHGVFWHEVVGHSLEGHRMQENSWGDKSTIFLERLGETVTPDFLSLYADPSIEGMHGSFKFDDEGIKSQKVNLIENGVLKSYLHSRESGGYFNTKSNGHARSEGGKDPCVRMSNLFVKSSNEVPYDELKENLIREVVDRKKPYGLILKDSLGGLTLPEASFFNTYPAHVFRIYPNGKEQRVRGIYIVGTPLEVLDHMVQTSDNYGTWKGFCGAESGKVPTSETAPDVLISSMEFNRIPKSSYNDFHNPVLPKPKLKR